MGTRGAYGFLQGEEHKVTYNHFDSYPSALGGQIVEFIRATPDDMMKAIANRIVMVNEDQPATPEQVAECAKVLTVDTNVASQQETDWYCLLRDAQGDLGFYQRGLRYMTDGRAFLKDSLFCEYAYIINLAEGVLEVYRGLNHDRSAPGRYASAVDETDLAEQKAIIGNGYAGVVLALTIPFAFVRQKTAEALIERMETACSRDPDDDAGSAATISV